MIVLGIHHANLTVPAEAVAQARLFFVEVLAMQEIAKPEMLRERGGFWLQLGDQQLHVSLQEEIDRWQARSHVAFLVRGLDAWRVRLQEKGIALQTPPQYAGYRRFMFRDPFGNRLEFIEAVEG